jgi:hypothetical protein
VSDGRIVGAVLGAGAVFGVTLLLTRRASAATRGSPRGSVPPREIAPPHPSPFRAPIYGPLTPLVARWRPEVEKRAGDLPVDAILEWIRIESGGDMCATGAPNEVGIFQLLFPDDAHYGATLEGLRAICQKSKVRHPDDISWLSQGELDMEVGAGIRKIRTARDVVRRVFAANGIVWPETSFDFGSAVKQIHAAPAVILELVPKIVHRDGRPLANWDDLRGRVMAFPVSQMGPGLRALANSPSRHGLKNRLEDTLRNAEFVGVAWAGPVPTDVV